MSKKIRVAIGGYGRSGCNIHDAHFRTDPRFEVVAVADAIESRRNDAVTQYGCRVYSSYHDMLQAGGFDLYVNATPSRFHYEAALEALKLGFHVVQEKPSAPTVAEFDVLVETAKQHGVQFLPFQNSRFYPYFKKIRDVLQSGVLGKIISIRSNWSGFARRWDWQTLRRELGGNLHNTGPHPIDQAVTLFGEGTPSVFCRMASDHCGIGGDAENFVALTLYGKDKPVIEIQISSFLAYPQGEMYNIQGTHGGLTGGINGVKWRYFNPKRAPEQKLLPSWSDERKYCNEKLEWQEESWQYNDPGCLENNFSGMSAEFYDTVYDTLINGKPPVVTTNQVRTQLMIMEQAYAQNFF